MIQQFYYWVYIWKTKNRKPNISISKKYMDPTVHRSIICNWQDMEVKVSISRQMDEEDVIYVCLWRVDLEGIVLSEINQKKTNTE